MNQISNPQLSTGVSNPFATRCDPAKKRFFWLLGAFMVIAPLSVSGVASRDGDDIMKWARVGILALIALVGNRWLTLPRSGTLAGKLFLFALVFTCAAAWSSSPVWGLLFKGMFLASVVGGICLGLMLNRESEFRAFARTMTITSLIALAGVVYLAVTQDDELLRKGRLWVAQINPNLLAQSAAVFGLLSLFHLLVGDTGSWRQIAIASAGAMAGIVVLSGSRGAFIMLAAGIAVMLPALGSVGRKKFVLAIGAICLICSSVVYWYVGEETLEHPQYGQVSDDAYDLRIVREMTKDTRASIWRYQLKKIIANPVIGIGWSHRSNRWALVQSAYLQVALETGIVGTIFLLSFLFASYKKVRQVLRTRRQIQGLHGQLAFVFAATLFALLLHGFFESSMIAGASPNALLVGFFATQLDRLGVAGTS